MLRYKYPAFYRSPSSAAVLQRFSQSALGQKLHGRVSRQRKIRHLFHSSTPFSHRTLSGYACTASQRSRNTFVVLEGDALWKAWVQNTSRHSTGSFWGGKKQPRPTRARSWSLILSLPKHNNTVLSICNHSTSVGSLVFALHLLQYCRANARIYNFNLRLNATLSAEEKDQFFHWKYPEKSTFVCFQCLQMF